MWCNVCSARVEVGRVTLFAVAADTEGVSRDTYATVDGLRAAEVMLDNVRVSADAVLGELDEGFAAVDATIDEATLDEWNRLVAVNMTGVFLGTKLATPALRENCISGSSRDLISSVLVYSNRRIDENRMHAS